MIKYWSFKVATDRDDYRYDRPNELYTTKEKAEEGIREELRRRGWSEEASQVKLEWTWTSSTCDDQPESLFFQGDCVEFFLYEMELKG